MIPRRRIAGATLVRRLVATALVLAALLVLATAGVVLAQRKLLYFPAREALAAATGRAGAMGLEPWTDGGELFGWRAAAARGPATARLVFFHGNAGSALDRTFVVETLRAAAPGLELFLAEYPGYGPRPGAPSEAALLDAAVRAIEAAARDAPGPLLVGGESLGTAVAARAAARDPRRLRGLLLVTPLASVPAVARRHYGPIAAALVRDTWRADRALPAYGGPVAFVVAGRDEIAFPDLGRALHDAYAGPKWLWLDPAATHNTVDWRPGNARWRAALAFLLGAPPPVAPPAGAR